MKISREDGILIKNLSVSKRYGAQRLLHKFPDYGWKLESIDSLLKRIRKTGTMSGNHACMRQTAFSARSGGPRAQSGLRRTSQKGIDQLVRFRVKLPFSVQVCTG